MQEIIPTQGHFARCRNPRPISYTRRTDRRWPLLDAAHEIADLPPNRACPCWSRWPHGLTRRNCLARRFGGLPRRRLPA